MRGAESSGDLTSDGKELLGGDRTPCQQILQALAADILHGDERYAVDFIDLENSSDIRVAETRSSPRLLEDHRPAAGAGGHVLGKHLECHPPTQVCIFCEIHLAHAARTELLVDSKVTDGLSKHRSPAILIDSVAQGQC